MPYPPRDGGSIRLFQLLKTLAGRHSVRLLALGNGEAAMVVPAQLCEICSSVEIFPLPPQPPRWSWRWWRGLLKGMRDPGFWYFTPALYARLRELCASGGADVVLLETSKMSSYGRRLGFVNAVLCRQNYAPDLSRRIAALLPFSRQKLMWWLGGTVLGERTERRMLRAFRYVTAVSEKDAQVFRRLSPATEVIVVPNGADLTRFTPVTGADDGRTVTMMGTMAYLPNRDGAIYFHQAIWPSVRALCPPARLVVLGHQAPARLPQLRGSAGVEVKEPVGDIEPDLAAATIVVVPLRAGGGTRIKILEALAMGKPVVTTSVGCEGLDVVAGRHLLVSDEPAEFARLVAGLLNDSTWRRQLAANGRTLVQERYSWEHAARSLTALCETIAGGARP